MNAPADTRAASHGNRYDSLFPNGLPGNSCLTAVRYAASHPSQRLYSPSTYPLSQTRRCTLWAVSHSLRGSPLRLACDLPGDTSYVINLIFFIPAWSRTMHLAPQGSAQDVPRVALLGVVDTSARPFGPSVNHVGKVGTHSDPLSCRLASCRTSSVFTATSTSALRGWP